MYGLQMLRRIALAAAIQLVLAIPAVAQTQPITIFAAASLKNALDEVIAGWKAFGGPTAVASYASSSALAKQIEQGAPADLFISADTQWMDYVTERKLVSASSNLLGNRLVLIAPKKSSVVKIDITPGFDLAKALGDGRLAVGDPTNVPAGLYAKESLTKLRVWITVESKLAPAADVRAALALVSRGETPLGIVYETDAKVDPNVKIVGTFPEDTHAPIVYPVARLVASQNPNADKFVKFIESSAAKRVFEKYGFSFLK